MFPGYKELQSYLKNNNKNKEEDTFSSIQLTLRNASLITQRPIHDSLLPKAKY